MSMIKKELFSTSIYSTLLNLDLNNMMKEVETFKMVQPSAEGNYSNAGGYQGHGFLYQPLIDAIIENVPVVEHKPEIKVKMSFWLNVNKYGDYNQIHNHDSYSGTFLSGVFYIKTPPNSGRIRFHDPRAFVTNAPDMEYYNDSASFYYYVPEPNMLLMFPGWLFHDVEPNRSNEDRISIAFNLVMQKD